MNALLAVLALLAAAPAAAALPACVDAPDGSRACVVASTAYGTTAAVTATGANGEYAEASFTEQPAFVGNVLVAMVWVRHPAAGGAYAGFGATDYGPDGTYESFCVCGEVYGLAHLLWGVGHFDADGDNAVELDGVYVELAP